MKNSEIINSNRNGIGFIDLVTPDMASPGQGKRSIRGTGFVVSSDGVFATNAHVYFEVPESERGMLGINLISHTDEKGITAYDRHPVEFISVDMEHDVALLKIKPLHRHEFQPVQGLGDLAEMNEGDEVLILGHPLGTEMMMMGFGVTATADQCIVSALKRKADGSFSFFMVDTHVNLGSSGSPVFSKETGKVVGIASGRLGMKVTVPNVQMFEVPANIGICRPVNYLEKLINQ